MLSGCFCPTGTAAEETDSFKKKGQFKSIFLVYTKKYIKKKNIDDARVTQDEVIVKHGLKKWQHFNLL
jgi:hypothetical protein